MSTKPFPPEQTGPWVEIVEPEEIEYAFLHFRVIKTTLRYRRFDGQMSNPIRLINFERGDSVGVLMYDPKNDTVLLVRQFRYPVYSGLAPFERASDAAQQAWTLELVAGVREKELSAHQVAHKELLEEAGYALQGALEPIISFYPSPGGSSERVHLFLAEVDTHRQVNQGGGVVAEGENTQVVALPFQKSMGMIASGEINDGKTIIALQHLALRRVQLQKFDI